MAIKFPRQDVDLTYTQNRDAVEAVPQEAYTAPSRVASMPVAVAQEVQHVTHYSDYSSMLVAEIAPSGDVAPPSGSLLARFDVDGNGSWSDEEYLASQLQLNMKNDCFAGDLAAMSTWLSEHGFTFPMSLDDASAALEMYLAESTS